MVNTTPWPLYLRESPGTLCPGGWLDPRADLDGCVKCHPPPGFDHPARSESLYRVSYRGPYMHGKVCNYRITNLTPRPELTYTQEQSSQFLNH